jgi:septum formation topological specificity factor MinE
MTREKYIRMSKPARMKWLARNNFKAEDEFFNSLTEGEDTSSEEIKESLDLIIAFDTTGSMAKYLKDVKNHIVNVVRENFDINPDLRIGIVAFGDYCDMKSATEFGRAYQYLPLTTNKNDIIDFVLGSKDTMGGDSDEFYELVIKKITEEVNWNEKANKVVLFIADCNPHPVGYSYRPFVKNAKIDWRVEAKKAASKGIKFNTLAILEYNKWYEELSSLTDGTYLPFKSSEKTTQLLNATLLAEGGKKTRNMFDLKMKGEKDIEMKSVYTSYSLKLK